MSDPAGETLPEQKNPLQRYVPLLVWAGVVATLLVIPLRIIGFGYLPPDDALRHVAKVLSGKSWAEIMVMRPEITIDHNAGWHAILGAVHRATNWDGDALVTFSVLSLFLLVLFVPLFFLRRPEVWIAVLLAGLSIEPHIAWRFALGRPYILVMAVFMAVLLIWNKQEDRVSKRVLAATTILIALVAWIHGGWYMYWIPAAGFFLAQQWRKGMLMTGCWLAGSFLGGLLTGHPVHFLIEQFNVLTSCFGHNSLQRMLVIEFLPIGANYLALLLIGFVLVAFAVTGTWSRKIVQNQMFMQAILCWALAFAVRRFWADWGIPALFVWMCLRVEELSIKFIPAQSLGRLIAAALICGATFLSMTSDIDSRWTNNLTKEYLKEGAPEYAGWLPGSGGIIYNDSMYVFYDTFFANPRAPWRYILGFEASFMPEDDLETFRKIQWNYGTSDAYIPWVKKMRPQDRMILHRANGGSPAIAGLEWKYAATMTWIGRLPQTNAPAAKTQSESK